jgi:predicted transcriptional regulator
MTEISLKDFLESGRNQTEAAKAMGCSQPAVSQMLAAGRDIYFTLNKKGRVVSVREDRKPGKRKCVAA